MLHRLENYVKNSVKFEFNEVLVHGLFLIFFLRMIIVTMIVIVIVMTIVVTMFVIIVTTIFILIVMIIVTFSARDEKPPRLRNAEK